MDVGTFTLHDVIPADKERMTDSERDFVILGCHVLKCKCLEYYKTRWDK